MVGGDDVVVTVLVVVNYIANCQVLDHNRGSLVVLVVLDAVVIDVSVAIHLISASIGC